MSRPLRAQPERSPLPWSLAAPLIGTVSLALWAGLWFLGEGLAHLIF